MSTTHSNATLLNAFIDCIQKDVIPLTQKGVESGSKLFGAAIIDRKTLKPVQVSTNNEAVSPLLHGETNCIQEFFLNIPKDKRPAPKDCIFLATHEPCSLCMSAITWSGFNQMHYLFTFEDSKEKFAIPYDIEIYQQVFRVPAKGESEQDAKERPLYNKHNKFFDAYSFTDMLEGMDEEQKKEYEQKINDIVLQYNGLSQTYQDGKKHGVENEAAFK